MTVQDAYKLVDLFLDDELPLELSLEFKELMFSDAKLAEEVSSRRQTREMFTDAFADDKIKEEERSRIYSAILAAAAAESQMRFWSPQFALPFPNDQLELPIQILEA